MSAKDCRGEPELLALLKELNIELPTISHGEMHTVEEANKELGRFGTPCVGTKNMFLKSRKGELVLLTAVHTTKTDMHAIEKAAGTKNLRFAPAEILSDNLAVVQGCAQHYLVKGMKVTKHKQGEKILVWSAFKDFTDDEEGFPENFVMRLSSKEAADKALAEMMGAIEKSSV